MDLADRIKIRMTQLDLTQEALANRAEIFQAMVYKLISRKSKSTTKVVQLANALECDVQWLAAGHSSKSHNEHPENYSLRQMTATELKKQLKGLSKEQRKSIALDILKNLM